MSLAKAGRPLEALSLPGRSPGWHGAQIMARWAGNRRQMAAGLATAFTRGELSEREKAVAVEVFKSLVHDTEVEVRRSLAEHIRSSPLLPRNLALEMAQDVEAVAMPILQSSPVLTDEDLIAVISAGSSTKHRAIAGREKLSVAISAALAATGEKSVIEILLANDNAEISDETYRDLLDSFASDASIKELLVERPELPFPVKVRLVALVSKALQVRIAERHTLPNALLEQLSRQGQERALLKSLAALKTWQEIDKAAQRLARMRALTATLLLRSLAAGLLEFSAAAVAALAEAPAAQTHDSLRRLGAPALAGLYGRTGLPVHLQPAFQIVLEAVLERRRSGLIRSEPAFERRIVDELVQAYRQISPDSLDSVIFQLDRLRADNPDKLGE